MQTRFEFCTICAIKCSQKKKKSLTAVNLELFKMTRKNDVFSILSDILYIFKMTMTMTKKGFLAIVRNFRTKYSRNTDLTPLIVKKLIKTFRETKPLNDLKHSGVSGCLSVVQHIIFKQQVHMSARKP